MDYKIWISISGDGPRHQGFGKGIVQLLDGIVEYGSINKATNNMGMSYSKAWKIIKEAEEEMGINLLDRDGANGSSLSPDGRRLLEAYHVMVEEANNAVKKMFDESFFIKKPD